MNLLKTFLNKPFSSQELVLLRNQLLQNPNLFDQLFSFFLAGTERQSQKAAGLICLCVEKQPELLLPYLPSLLAKLREEPVRNSIKRNILRMLQYAQIPEELEGEFIELCFSYLESAREAVAIQAFSMPVLFKLSDKYPELKQELKILIEDQLPYQKPGFISRGKKILAWLNKN